VLQHFLFRGREVFGREAARKLRRNGLRNPALTCGDRLNGPDYLRAGRGLQDIAKCTFTDAADYILFVIEHGHHQYSGIWITFDEPMHDLQAIDARHSQIKGDDVRLDAVVLADGFIAIGGFAGNLESWLRRYDCRQSESQGDVVIDD
jgi:hypothetical protein